MKRACVTLPRHLTPDKVKVSQTLINGLVDSLWSKSKSENVFRYELSESCLRSIPGQCQFCADYNEHRFSKKRAAHSVSSCNQPFNDSLFNFSKLNDSEILLEVSLSDDADCVSFSMDSGSSLVAVNSSPISESHILLLPSPEKCLNQRLTLGAIELGLSFSVNCGDPDLRVVFNSLRAFASINHLHLHAYKCSASLPIESAPVQHLADCCYKLTTYPVPGFVFQLQTDTVSLAKSVFTAVEVLQEQDIPHNMMITYGDPCTPHAEPTIVPEPVLRVCLWPVKPSDQLPTDKLLFKPAVCEISGHILLHDLDLFQTITETQIINTLKINAFEEDQFQEIAALVKKKLEAVNSSS